MKLYTVNSCITLTEKAEDGLLNLMRAGIAIKMWDEAETGRSDLFRLSLDGFLMASNLTADEVVKVFESFA